MPNILDANGLQLATRAEWVEFFTEKYQQIYGSDINLSSDTPDGQMMNINIQVILDMQDLIAEVYNGFDPDLAIGTVLDQRVAINGIQRLGGTYTITPITIVTSQSVTLQGLDLYPDDPYTVSDNAGNRWFLQETQAPLAPGTTSLNFRAEVPGEQLTLTNTINVPVTIILGVDSVNNPTTYTTLGTNEESDAVLRVRRQQSVSLASQGFLAGLYAALSNIEGVTSAYVYENNTDTTDSQNVPGHSIWVIVGGTADPEDIAQAIYTKRNAGCGMKGDETYTITQVDGSPFIVKWDDVVTRTVFIRFTATSIDGIISPNIEAIREQLPNLVSADVAETLNVNEIGTAAQSVDSNALLTNIGISLGTVQTIDFSGIAASGSFKVNYNGSESAAINWNDSIGTIQTKVQAVSGLSSATVTGSIASQQLVFTLTALGDVLALIYIVDNTLETGAAVDITFTYEANYTNTLAPPLVQNQLIISEANVIITAIQISPSTTEITASGNVQFEAFGGYGPYTYAITVDNSGASIDDETGLYTAGSSTSVTDTVQVTDAFGNSATASVLVV